VTADEFRIGVAEVLDVIVRPAGADAFTIFAQSMDRTGYARGTLAVRAGLSAPVPELDRIVYLMMADMGHGGAGHGAGASAADLAALGHGPASATDTAASAGDTAQIPSMDHAAMGHPMPQIAEPAPMDHSAHAMPRGDPAPAAASIVDHSAHAGATAGMQTHPASELDNPAVDMQTMTPTARLDDPGVGLRANGRRVLTYADLRTLYADPDGREPGRTVELHLTGHMGRYMWSFDGIQFSDADPIRLVYGERVRLVLVNDTMMEHPIHLHGLWSDLESEAGEFQLRKHTISIPPGTRRSYRVTADALGRWAYHCHLLYHMEAGMFREIRVEPVGGLRR
jgi:CopA family copper-resistance protein